MGAAICAEELQLMQKKSTRGVLIAEYIAVSIGLPCAQISMAIASMYLFILMFFYFRKLSIQHLNVCYDNSKPQCVRCLKKIYKNEQNMLRISRKLKEEPLLKWIYQWMIDRLEDRAEMLIFTVDEEASEKLVSIISKIETQKLERSNWTQDLHAL